MQHHLCCEALKCARLVGGRFQSIMSRCQAIVCAFAGFRAERALEGC